MLKKSVETRDWLHSLEPRTVRAVMKRVVEEITSVDSQVRYFEILYTYTLIIMLLSKQKFSFYFQKIVNIILFLKSKLL